MSEWGIFEQRRWLLVFLVRCLSLDISLDTHTLSILSLDTLSLDTLSLSLECACAAGAYVLRVCFVCYV